MSTQSLSPSVSIDASAQDSGSEQLYMRRVAELYAQAPLGIVASLVNASILSFVQWDIVSPSRLLIWLSSILTINLLWSVLVVQYRKNHIVRPQPHFWHSWFLVGNVVSGMAWGAFAIFLYPHVSIPHQIFLALVLGGMLAGATAVHSGSISAFLAY
ncbi:MAG: hypothetical protein ACPGYT_16130, partial [Nitrospirales bacterium]